MYLENTDDFFHYLKVVLHEFYVVIIVLMFKLFIMEIFKCVQTRENSIMNFHVPIKNLQYLSPSWLILSF